MKKFDLSWNDKETRPSSMLENTNYLHATHQMIEMLQKSKKATEDLFDCIPDLIFIIDKDGRILLSNNQADSVMKSESGVSILKSIKVLLSADQWNHLDNGLSKLTTHDVIDLDIDLVIDGGLCSYNFRCKKVGGISERRGNLFFLIGRETSHLKDLIEEIKDKNSKLQTQNQTLQNMVNIIKAQRSLLTESTRLSQIGEMAGAIAHEINNPISIIKGYADLIKSGILNGKLSENAIVAKLDKISTTVDRVANIISGIRGLARDSGDDPFEMAPLNQIIENTMAFTKEKFKMEQIDLILNLAPESDLNIVCRPPQISQVLINLLNNAYDAIKSLEERWVRIDAFTVEEEIVLTVTDSGQGIPQNLIKDIFLPFFSTKPASMGTGLGLSISASILKQHKARFEIDETCQNTKFVIGFPKIDQLSAE